MNDYGCEIFRLTNAERFRYGLSPLTWSDILTDVARKHSVDLVTSNTFSHTGSDGSSPEERVDKSGVAPSFLGENISGGRRDPKVAMQDWLASAGHRANILHVDAIYLGVGIAYAENSKYKIYVTQIFGR